MAMDARHVFISYVREDLTLARRLSDALSGLGFQTWIDESQLTVGRRWRSEIRSAVVSGGAFLACFSTNSERRDRSYMREEILVAISELRRRPRDQSWFFPVMFDECSLPDIETGPGETLRDLHYVNLESNFQEGVRRIASGLRPEHQIIADLLENAELAIAANAFGEAHERLSSALSLNPRDPQALGLRGLVNAKLGDLEASIQDYEDAGSSAWPELSYIYWCASDIDSAIATLKRLAKYGRATVQSEYDLGCILFQATRGLEARDAFQRALAFAPDDLTVTKALVNTLLRIPADFEALFELTKNAIDRFGPDPDFLEAQAFGMVYNYRMIQTYSFPDDFAMKRDQILEMLRDALELDPSNVRRLYRVAMLAFRLGAYEVARTAASRGLQLKPDSSSFRVVLAQVCEYGSSDKKEGIENSVRYYDEANSFPVDDLDREGPFTRLRDDVRTPRPVGISFKTIPLTVAGVATSKLSDDLEDYSVFRQKRAKRGKSEQL
jgi:tetratricopeptide (TPR) repeat protein